jgi:hypothetical protein
MPAGLHLHHCLSAEAGLIDLTITATDSGKIPPLKIMFNSSGFQPLLLGLLSALVVLPAALSPSEDPADERAAGRCWLRGLLY